MGESWKLEEIRDGRGEEGLGELGKKGEGRGKRGKRKEGVGREEGRKRGKGGRTEGRKEGRISGSRGSSSRYKLESVRGSTATTNISQRILKVHSAQRTFLPLAISGCVSSIHSQSWTLVTFYITDVLDTISRRLFHHPSHQPSTCSLVVSQSSPPLSFEEGLEFPLQT